MTNLSLSEKRTVYQILTLIMKADLVLKPVEISFLDKVFEDFNLSVDEFDHMEDLDFDLLSTNFLLLSDDKKEYAKHFFLQMAECDGYVDPRELAIIEKLLV